MDYNYLLGALVDQRLGRTQEIGEDGNQKQGYIFDCNTNRPNYEEDRKKYIEEDLPKYLDISLNSRPLSVSEINQYIKIYYEESKGYNLMDKDKKPFVVHELSSTEKKQKQEIHKKACEILKQIMIEGAERELPNPNKKDHKFSRPGMAFAKALNIDEENLANMSPENKKKAFLQLLDLSKDAINNLYKAKSDVEILDYYKDKNDLITSLGEIEPNKMKEFIKELGLSDDKEISKATDDFFKKYETQATSISLVQKRIEVMANPYYAEVNMNEFIMANSLDDFFERSFEFPQVEKMMTKKGLFINTQNYKSNDDIKDKLNKGMLFNPIMTASFGGIMGLREGAEIVGEVRNGIPQVEDYLDVHYGAPEASKKIDFIDPKTGEKADYYSVIERMIKGEKFFVKDENDNLTEIGVDGIYGNIDVKEKVETLNISSKEDMEKFSKELLDDLKTTKTLSLTASKEFGKLEKAVKDLALAKNDTPEITIEKTEKIIEAAKGYLDFRRYTTKKVNEKTNVRMNFAEKMISKLNGVPGLSKYLEKEKELNKDNTKNMNDGVKKNVNLEATKKIIDKLEAEIGGKESKIIEGKVETKSKEVEKTVEVSQDVKGN